MTWYDFLMAASANEELVITVRELRQNPAEMIHKVRLGADYVLTDRGVPTARIIPFRQDWKPEASVRQLLTKPTDPTWLKELQDDRLAESPEDPWEK
jgi:prevent-host-death family protein